MNVRKGILVHGAVNVPTTIMAYLRFLVVNVDHVTVMATLTCRAPATVTEKPVNVCYVSSTHLDKTAVVVNLVTMVMLSAAHAERVVATCSVANILTKSATT